MKCFRMTPYAVAALLIAFLVPLPTSAAPPDAKHLPEDAKWVIHIDLKALSETDLAREARDERPQMTQIVRRWLQTNFGVDPREDLDSLTMFSNTYEEYTGTMLLKADYDQAKVQAALEERPDVHKEMWGNQSLYTLTGDRLDLLRARANDQRQVEQERIDTQRAEQERTAQVAAGEQGGGRPMTIALVDGKMVVIASSAERAKAAVTLARGDSPTLAEDSPLLAELDEGALVYGAAVELDKIEQRGGIFPILSQHEQAYWCVSTQNGQVAGKLKLHAKSEEVAEHMKTWLEGSVAFGQVWAADSENLKKLVDNREVSRDGKMVQISGQGDAETVRGAFNELRARFEQRIQPRAEATATP